MIYKIPIIPVYLWLRYDRNRRALFTGLKIMLKRFKKRRGVILVRKSKFNQKDGGVK